MHRVRSKRASLTARGFPAAHSNVGAFTLIELLVVIIVIAALAALVVSKMDGAAERAEDIAIRSQMRVVAEGFVGSAEGPGFLADMKYLPGFQSEKLEHIQTGDLLSNARYPNSDFNPAVQRGWRGPYLRFTSGVQNTERVRNGAFPASDERRTEDDRTFLERAFYSNATTSPYGVEGNPAIADSWGNPIVVQVPPPSAFSNSTGIAKRFRYARLVSAGADGELQTPLNHRLAGLEPLPNGKVDTTLRGDDFVLFLNRHDSYEAEEL